uniref:28S ribosomal protein S14 n=1 Tax=Schistocephalus solidus TaxID=70667 RepID=A0A0X3NTX9_SCHSO
MALRHLTKLFSSCAIGATSTAKSMFNLAAMTRSLHMPPRIPQSVFWEHTREPYKTFPHHSSPEHERLLKEELLDYPPYRNWKIRHGFQDAIMVRDYKRRIVAAHFAPLRVRLNAIRKNTILPKDIRDTASVQIHSLPRDSCFTRIMTRCVVTSRRRGCKTRWRVSRIIFRNYADYNRMSGAIWAVWVHHTQCTRRHMVWPPPAGISTTDYIEKYHKNLGD